MSTIFHRHIPFTIDDDGYVNVRDIVKFVYGATGLGKVKSQIKSVCPKRKNRVNVVHISNLDDALHELKPLKYSHLNNPT